VVSHHHDGFLHTEVTGLLHPATDRGFVAFLASEFRSVPKEAPDGSWHSPQRGSYPPKISPRQQPYRITAAVALFPLLSCPGRDPAEAEKLPAAPAEAEADTRRRTPRGAVTPNPKGNGKGRAGRSSNAMMLRSAEADPHVTEHSNDQKPKLPSAVARNRRRHRAHRSERSCSSDQATVETGMVSGSRTESGTQPATRRLPVRNPSEQPEGSPLRDAPASRPKTTDWCVLRLPTRRPMLGASPPADPKADVWSVSARRPEGRCLERTLPATRR
jgi:hypothetical protein